MQIHFLHTFQLKINKVSVQITLFCRVSVGEGVLIKTIRLYFVGFQLLSKFNVCGTCIWKNLINIKHNYICIFDQSRLNSQYIQRILRILCVERVQKRIPVVILEYSEINVINCK